jgi:hypothetical protein
MINYIEITDVTQIRKLNSLLQSRLKKSLRFVERRTIGSPSGSFQATVRFLRAQGDEVFWWSALHHKNKMKNLFGHGTPGSNRPLYMDVQFNVPAVHFSRRSGGAFLRHRSRKNIVLAHRGIVTLGHGRFPKELLFRRFRSREKEAHTGNGEAKFLTLTELRSPSLIDEISRFCTQVRGIVRTSKMQLRQNQVPKDAPVKHAALARLREYFDEFTGQYHISARAKTLADSYHGAIVRKLRTAFGTAKVLKNREIDLVVVTRKAAFLIEAKKSTTPQDIYTAVGQLTIHTSTVKRCLPGLAVRKAIVLPQEPSKHVLELLQNELEIIVLTFTRSTTGKINLECLDKLK